MTIFVLGVGQYADESTLITELHSDRRPKTLPPRSSIVKKLGRYIDEDSACSACYAALVFALNKHGGYSGESIKVGQGFRGKQWGGFGVGNCTSGCDRFVKGCPPSALDILEAL